MRRPCGMQGIARQRWSGLALGAWALAWAAANGPAQAQTVEGQVPSEPVMRVIVSAQKRVSALGDTPAAVTVLDGNQLDEQGATQLLDLAARVPNMQFTTSEGMSQLYLRGIGDRFIAVGGDPGVATYSDGSYVSDAMATDVGLFDTQRIEVLRGPQGALYGRNAIGGAVNFMSARPTERFSAQAGVLVGNDDRYESEGFVSGPLGDSGTRARLAYQVKSFGGYTANPLAGMSFPPVLDGSATTVGPRRLDDLGSRALRIQTVTPLPSAAGGDATQDASVAGSLRVIALHYRDSEAGPSVAVLTDPVMVSQLLGGVLPSGDPRVVKSEGASHHVGVDSLQALVEEPLAPGLLDVVASWRRSSTGRFVDTDATEASIVTTEGTTSSTDVSIDAHLASVEEGRLQWLVGVTALRFAQRQDVDVPLQVPFGFVEPGQPLTQPLPGGADFAFGGDVLSRSVAMYADLHYVLTPSLALLAGARLDHDSKSANAYERLLAFGVNGTTAPAASWNSTPGNVGVEYRPSAALMGYAKVSRGFKSGAVNLGSLQTDLVKPETVVSVEVGAKTEWLDRRATVDVAVFYSHYRNMQVQQVNEVATVLANASAARIAGAEVEAQLRPVAALALGLGLGFMSPTYTDFVNTDLRNNPTQPVNVAGRQLADVSRDQVSVTADLDVPLAGLKGTLHADFAWRSHVYFTEFNTPDARQGGYGLLNFGASVASATGRWKAYAQLRNATGTTALYSMGIASPIVASERQVTYTPPRQFALGATLAF